MEAIRVHKLVTDDRVAEIMRYVGQKVEIIIFPEEPVHSEDTKVKINPLLELRGSCPNIIDGRTYQNKIRAEWER